MAKVAEEIASISSLPIDEPYAKPDFDLIDFNPSRRPHSIRKAIGIGIIGLYPYTDDEGNLTHLGVNNIVLNDLTNFPHYLIKLPYSTYVVYRPHELEVLLKPLGQNACRDLFTKKSISYKGIRIWFTPNRGITLRYKDVTVRVQCISEWFKNKDEDKVLKELNIEETGALGREKLGFLVWNSCRNLGDELPGNIASPSIITNDYLYRDYRQVEAKTIPLPVYRLAYESIHAPWVELISRGRFKTLHDFDINSAYPYHVKNLINIDDRHGQWIQSDLYHPKAEYGFCYALIHIYDKIKISPILIRKAGALFSATGLWVGTINKDEIDFIHKYNIGKVDILNGWWFVPKLIEYPFRRTVNHLFQLRYTAKQQGNQILNTAVKLSAARLVGKFLQRKNVTLTDDDLVAGPAFNPVYANVVMTKVKLQLAELAFQNPGAVKGIIIDGLLTSNGLGVNVHDNPGEVKLEHKGDGVLLTPYTMFRADGRSPYDIINVIMQKPLAQFYTVPVTFWARMCECLIDNTFHLVGKRYDNNVPIPVTSEHKRWWDVDPMTGVELLTKKFESEPHLADFLEWQYPTNSEAPLTNFEFLSSPSEHPLLEAAR